MGGKFVKGQSGNPGGKPKEKMFADAIRIAVKRLDKDGKSKLAHLADKLVEYAMAGEGWAFAQIADRLDGKAHQTIEGAAEVVHRYVADVPKVAESIEEWQQQHGSGSGRLQ